MPKITILLPVYNAEKYIKDALQSIINQTFNDFELWIFNDASTDNSLQIIKSFKDSRIKVFDSPINQGYVHYLNKGLGKATTKYIARMDADDISDMTRFEKQITFLEQNPTIAIVGTQAKYIYGEQVSNVQFYVNTDTRCLPVISLFYTPFIHPSIMMRTEMVKEFRYKKEYMPAEDYELWTSILQKYPCANLSESLLQYRIHDNNISTTQNVKQLNSIRRIYRANLEQISMPYTETDLDIYLKISGSYHQKIDLTDLKKIEKWLLKMRTHLMKESLYDKNIIRVVIELTWFRLCLKNGKYTLLKGYFAYLNSDLTKGISTKKSIYLLLHTIGNYPIIKPIYKVLKRYFLAILKIKN